MLGLEGGCDWGSVCMGLGEGCDWRSVCWDWRRPAIGGRCVGIGGGLRLEISVLIRRLDVLERGADGMISTMFLNADGRDDFHDVLERAWMA